MVLNLFESHTLFLRSSPFLMSFRSLFAIAELIHRFLHNLETTIVKTYSRKKECPVREVSVGEVPGRPSIRRGTVLRGSASLGSVQEEVPVG